MHHVPQLGLTALAEAGPVERGLGSAARYGGKLVSVLVIVRCPMQTWPIQDAKARFSEFLETCLAEGPQMVTKRGAEAAVLVPVDEWRRLKAAARPSLKQLLLSDQGRSELVLASRGYARRRPQAPAR
jgi:antitoxin Phd